MINLEIQCSGGKVEAVSDVRRVIGAYYRDTHFEVLNAAHEGFGEGYLVRCSSIDEAEPNYENMIRALLKIEGLTGIR